VPFLMTDAALAGGMSGGPLYDEHGQIISVNALVDGRLRGIGNLAMCGDRAPAVAEAIVRQGRAENRMACREIRLYNDRYNKRARVLGTLRRARLSEEDAGTVTMRAHASGRGVVRMFRAVATDVGGERGRAGRGRRPDG